MAQIPAREAGYLSETAGRYLEAIYYIAHEGDVARPAGLADWLGVSRPTVTVTLQRLARDGWVELAEDRSISLTPAGEAAASDLVRRHRILERWLVDVLGLDWAAGDREASLLVHGVSDEVVDRLTEARASSVVVVDPEGRPLGRVLADDVIDALKEGGLRLKLPWLFH